MKPYPAKIQNRAITRTASTLEHDGVVVVEGKDPKALPTHWMTGVYVVRSVDLFKLPCWQTSAHFS